MITGIFSIPYKSAGTVPLPIIRAITTPENDPIIAPINPNIPHSRMNILLIVDTGVPIVMGVRR
ncbi:hypothetical protein [Methanococcoides burtonii]|uniref:hypothetical protein n=1 Tax=Methanococcoides burtonii TaxID=29291 RepID=UPI0012F65692|nr:hypothetical protein [Methanococcoides burtonii]